MSYGRGWKLRLSLIEEKKIQPVLAQLGAEGWSSIGRFGMGSEWSGRRNEVGITALAAWSKLLLLEVVLFVLSQRFGQFFLITHVSSPVLHYRNAEIWENSCDSYPLSWRRDGHHNLLLEKCPSPWHLFPSMTLSLFPSLSPLRPPMPETFSQVALYFTFDFLLVVSSGRLCVLCPKSGYIAWVLHTLSSLLSSLNCPHSHCKTSCFTSWTPSVLIWSLCPRKAVEET